MIPTIEDIELLPVDEQNISNHPAKNSKFSLSRQSNLKQMIFWIFSFLCLIILAGPVSLYLSSLLPSVQSRTIARDQFSEERALDYLTNLTSYGSRVINTRGNFQARDYLALQIRKICSMNKRNLRCEIDLQNLTDSYQNQSQNVLARVSNPNTKLGSVSSLLLSAHYDTVEFSSGGSDDGAGVVILLELFSNLIHDTTVTFSHMNLVVLFTNGEETGDFLGSRAFLANHSWYSSIRRFINVDSITCNEKFILNNIKSSQLIMEYRQVHRPNANVALTNFFQIFEANSDYSVFSKNGSSLGYEFAAIFDGYLYHTKLDRLDLIKPGVVQELGENLGILIRHLFSKTVGQNDDDMSDDDPLIYFDIFGRYLMIYKLSTSRFLQIILITLIIIFGIILIVLDDLLHRRKTFECEDCYCIHFYFRNPSRVRWISIFIYSISNIYSMFTGVLVSTITAGILFNIQPVLGFNNPSLAMILYTLSSLIGCICISSLTPKIHKAVLNKWFRNPAVENYSYHKINFDFEQNFSVLIVYGILMFLAIRVQQTEFYLILLWSTFICPIYLCIMIIQTIYHWKQRYLWFYLPLIVSLFPLAHTTQLINRSIRLLIPLIARQVIPLKSLIPNQIISACIVLPNVLFLLILLPIVQRVRYINRVLISLLIILLILILFSYYQQPFDKLHPEIYYAKHTSTSKYYVDRLSTISRVRQSASISVQTYYGHSVPSLLDKFASESGYPLQNRACLNSTFCEFNDTFNRSLAIHDVQIYNNTLFVQHSLSYHINVTSRSSINFTVRNRLDIPRSETFIDLPRISSLRSFTIDVGIRRCDLADSPFLILFSRYIKDTVLVGTGQCQAIDDNVAFVFNHNKFP